MVLNTWSPAGGIDLGGCGCLGTGAPAGAVESLGVGFEDYASFLFWPRFPRHDQLWCEKEQSQAPVTTHKDASATMPPL